jgi:hypothetical protein
MSFASGPIKPPVDKPPIRKALPKPTERVVTTKTERKPGRKP